MKIAISELEPQDIKDIEPMTGGAIIGGKTGATIFAESFATGDVTITQSDSDVYTFSYKSDRGVYNLSLGFGYAFGFSYEAFS